MESAETRESFRQSVAAQTQSSFMKQLMNPIEATEPASVAQPLLRTFAHEARNGYILGYIFRKL